MMNAVLSKKSPGNAWMLRPWLAIALQQFLFIACLSGCGETSQPVAPKSDAEQPATGEAAATGTPEAGQSNADAKPASTPPGEADTGRDSDAAAAKAEDTKPRVAATVSEAVALIDLSKLKMLPGAEPAQLAPTQVSYAAPSTIAEAQEFYAKLFAEEGWQPLQNSSAPTASEEYAQLDFTREPFTIGVALSRQADGQINVSLINYGNLDARHLPQPDKSQGQFASHMLVLYSTDAPVPEVAEACRKQLEQSGWQHYTLPHADQAVDNDQRTLNFKQNGVALSAYVARAQTEDGKTSIQYSLRMLEDELPAPRGAASIQFLESPLQLTCETERDVSGTLAFYQQALAARGWRQQGEATVQPEETIAVFHRAAGLPVVLLLKRPEADGPTQVSLAEFEMPSAPSVAETPASPSNEPQEGEPPLPLDESADVPLPGALSKLMTYEDWLKKNNFDASPERLQQYAAEMEKLATELEIPADDDKQ